MSDLNTMLSWSKEGQTPALNMPMPYEQRKQLVFWTVVLSPNTHHRGDRIKFGKTVQAQESRD